MGMFINSNYCRFLFQHIYLENMASWNIVVECHMIACVHTA